MNNTSLILVGMTSEEAQSQRQAIVDILYHMNLINTNDSYQNVEACDLGEALRQRPSDGRVTLVVGGVGATPEDRTIRAVSDVLGLSMEYDLETGTRLSRFQSLENSALVYDCAWLPQGAIVLENEIGPAPGCVIEQENDIIILLPGAPSELAAMLQARVKPYLDNILNGETVRRTCMIFGLNRDTLADRLKEFRGKINPSVDIEAGDQLHRITVSATARHRDTADAIVAQTMSQLFHLFGSAAFGADCGSFEEVLVNLMKHNRLRVATAESCTAGLLSARLVNVPGASDVFDLGVTAYAGDKKVNVLQVPVNIIQRYGEVSAETAVSMASGVRQLSHADIGVGITGIAGPEGGSPEKPVGLVFIAVVDQQNAVIRRLKLGQDKSRDDIRATATLNAMDLLRKYLVSYPAPLKEAMSLKDLAETIRKAMQQPADAGPGTPFMNMPPRPNGPGQMPSQYPGPVPTPPMPNGPAAPTRYPAPPYHNQQFAVERIVNEMIKI